MGLPVEVNNLMMGSLGGYNVNRSLRFRSSASAYLNRTPASTTNTTIWTWSGWVKRGISNQGKLFGAATSTSNIWYLMFSDNITDALTFGYYNGTNAVQVTTTPLYRDYSAWYHVILSVDTSQATSSNRVKIYINGVQVTSFATSTYPTLNQTTLVNSSTAVHYLGRTSTDPANSLDGYLAEVNFIDGQALTPSSFGAYDTNGVWQPKKYTGTYGTNGFYLPFSNSQVSSYGGGFNGSTQYLTTPTNAAFNIFGGDMTAEAWIYPTNLSGRTEHVFAFVENSTNRESVYFNGTTLTVWTSSTSGGSGPRITSTAIVQNEWNHIAIAKSGSTFTLYVNGVSQGTSTTTAYSTANQYLRIGAYDGTNPADFFTGTISNVRIVKGTAVYTSNFIPSSSPLTAVTNTQLLTLQNATIVDNSTNAFTITNTGSVATSVQYPFIANITGDYSGNVNNWTANNIGMSPSSTTYDSMIDSPTVSASASNYATWNALQTKSTLSQANLLSTGGGGAGTFYSTASTISISTGKWYWEITCVSNTDGLTGIVQTSQMIDVIRNTNYVGQTSLGYGYHANGNKYNNASSSAYGATYTTGDIIGVAFDADARTLVYYKNGVSQGTAFTVTAGYTWLPADSVYQSDSKAVNFGQQPFSYTPPTGFNALNTYNLPAPSITNGAQYMAATTYTGNGTSQTITNGGNNTLGTTFQPDLVWAKIRSTTGNHSVYDSVRGAQQWISTNLTNAEGTYPGVTAFNSNGFSVGSDGGVNQNAATFVAWQWKAGGTGVTNNSGTITSTVSANPTAGFSVVTFTAQSSGTGTVGHGLGVAPSLIITKPRANAYGWTSYHESLGNTKYIELNTTSAASTLSTVWNNTSPTSTVFTLGSSFAGNGTYVAYCFAAVSGYSAMGSYTGNGSSDGPFIFTNFRPRWIMIKRTDSAGFSWSILDTSRNTYNVSNLRLFADSSGADNTQDIVDILSNGFKLRTTNTNENASGGTYVWAAFCENPFKYSRGR